jgi:hypothetical protein
LKGLEVGMMCRVLALGVGFGLFGCAATGPAAELAPAAPAAEAPRPPAPARGLEEATAVYLAQAAFDRPVAAPATGGLFGWVFPQIYVWFPALDGTMRAGNDRIDLQDDLGLEEGDASLMPQIQLSLGGVGLKFGAYFVRFEGQGTLTRSFEFGGVTFLVNEDVTTTVRIDNYRLVSIIPIVKTDFLAIYLQGGISYFHLEGTIRGELSGSGSGTADVPLPVAGVLAQAKVGPVVFELDASGFSLDVGDVGATVLDVQATIGVVLFKVVGVRAGYRLVVLDGHSEDFAVDGTLEGFFAGASVQF